MRQFEVWKLSELVQELTKQLWIANFRSRYGERDVDIDDRVVDMLSHTVKEYEQLCKALKLKAVATRLGNEFRLLLLGAGGHPTWGMIEPELRLLWELTIPELKERQFVFIAPRKAEILNAVLGREDASSEHQWDWKAIWSSFPSTKNESEEAVYCYTLERNTACVFHSMRVAEIGLRAFARRMRVKLPKGKPLEWAQWQEMLREMEKINDKVAQSMAAGQVKDELLEFNRGVLGQFYGFKDEYRNYVMHARKSYDTAGAYSALTRVHDFASKLATHIDEKGRKRKS
jgi:hypothetical protein